MAKAILVMDMPEKCGKCDLFICYRQYAGDPGDCFCGKTRQSTLPNDKPSWCPLNKVPSKYAEKDYTPIKDKRYDNGYEDGWNACIDAIRGKE